MVQRRISRDGVSTARTGFNVRGSARCATTSCPPYTPGSALETRNSDFESPACDAAVQGENRAKSRERPSNRPVRTEFVIQLQRRYRQQFTARTQFDGASGPRARNREGKKEPMRAREGTSTSRRLRRG